MEARLLPHNSGEDIEDIDESNKSLSKTEQLENVSLVVNAPQTESDIVSKSLNENQIQTPYFSKELDKKCKKVFSHYNSAIDETGSNLLYLAIGFLEWYEADHSDNKNQAPLILIPLQIIKSKLNAKTNTYPYSISYSGEGLESNLSLIEKLSHDFGIIFPEYSYDIAPSDYFEAVGSVISTKTRWKLNTDLVVAFFSFSKIFMFRDLDESRWPKGQKPKEHDLVRQVLIGSNDESETSGLVDFEPYNIDKDENAQAIKLVLDADSSQHSALVDAVIKRNNLVIEGPPGTGKSQTIANLIATALGENLNVLFLAEKRAALDVVRNRLDNVGLGDYVLELHSHKTHKGQLHNDLKKTT